MPVGTAGDDHLGQHAIAAAGVENTLAPLRRQQVDDGTGTLGDETPLAGIVISCPVLDRLRRQSSGVYSSGYLGLQGS